MRERWQQFTSKERRTILAGSIVLGFVLGYFFLYSPLRSGIQQLQEDTQQQQALLTWMEPAAKRIQALRQNQVTKTQSTQLALLPLIEQSLKNTDLNKQVVELSQTENNKVRIKFKLVSFDQLVTWLADLWKKNAIAAEELSVIPKTSGMVEATVIVSKSNTALNTSS